MFLQDVTVGKWHEENRGQECSEGRSALYIRGKRGRGKGKTYICISKWYVLDEKIFYNKISIYANIAARISAHFVGIAHMCTVYFC